MIRSLHGQSSRGRVHSLFVLGHVADDESAPHRCSQKLTSSLSASVLHNKIQQDRCRPRRITDNRRHNFSDGHGPITATNRDESKGQTTANRCKKRQVLQRRRHSRRVSGKVLQVTSIARHFRTLLRVDVRLRRGSATIGHNCSQLATTPRRHSLTIPLSLCHVWLASMLTARWRQVDDSSPSVAPRLAGWPVA